MKELVTVIVPIYNVEKYLNRCLDSILNQTYKNLEIILVDDGSTDSSSKICDEYKKKDQRIIVIHKKNGGLSDARNIGIEKARGSYISLIDSDDYVNKKFIQVLYDMCKKNNTLISQCSHDFVYDNNYIQKGNLNYNENLVSGRDIIKSSFKENYLDFVVAWNKLYKKEIFENLKYPYGKLHEDEFTTYKIFYDIEKVAITSQKLYYYYQSPNSIINKKYNLKRLDIIEAIEKKLDFFENKNNEVLYNLTLKQLYLVLIYSKYNCKKYIEDINEILTNIDVKIQKNYKKILNSNKFSMKYKMKIIIAKIFPNISMKLYNKLKKSN